MLLHFQRFGIGAARWLSVMGLILVPTAAVGALLVAMHTRPQWVQLREDIHETQVREERKALRSYFRETALPAEESAREAYNNAIPILNKEPGQRLAIERKETVESLARAREQLSKARQQLAENSPPWKTPEIKDAFEGLLAYLDALSELCAVSEEHIQDSQGKDGLEKLGQAMEQLKSLQEKWKLFL
jgi:hypothetical protein